jgi:hypothetical protein
MATAERVLNWRPPRRTPTQFELGDRFAVAIGRQLCQNTFMRRNHSREQTVQNAYSRAPLPTMVALFCLPPAIVAAAVWLIGRRR